MEAGEKVVGALASPWRHGERYPVIDSWLRSPATNLRSVPSHSSPLQTADFPKCASG